MAAGAQIQHKRKSSAFAGGELAIGELGLNTNNGVWYYSTDGSTVTILATGITRTRVVSSGAFTAGSAASTDYIYLLAGAHPVTLPTASGNSNRYTFKNNHSAGVSITRAGADTVEGGTSITISPQASVDLISDGTSAWYVI